ncbi:MAG: serine/threonine protein kinase [gamma proteobacterium symbiont of Bathyaustriella thionipta]|nr:serine/threonine protein kinase [gamma proteobacterium symbiont of Bathyaustriella thionipta]MCU7949977.1 serine/threonine protein kinase [gamma proteobacterium symbiont of Bathyaustriella thionipta]MCU7954773.1 serine/threonine protein kinase [gamma proteobacterium symbiont of Bathyaustriella thionipta]MCU7956555.1 serine/threonine protein kinase [gamma proteobacterium symbiont of Bathyaustriella thionipta]MCU7966550.1 serine/threonine protein kinase [gamma proteobacterium symbiont of Bathy
MEHNIAPLPNGTQVDNYIIDSVLGGGGFSIVYNAHLVSDNNQTVIIKEFMPKKLAVRINKTDVRSLDTSAPESYNKGRKLFFQEASTLATLKHPNIVDVTNFFQTNGTAYMVMKDEKGVNLQDYIRKYKGKLSEKLLRVVFPQLLSGVKMIHDKDLLHLDIKPSNIHLRQGGRPLLLDFGAVREQSKTRLYDARVVATSGFAPIEQVTERGYMGPWTDIYAIGATMRSCIEGTPPPAASKRKDSDPMKPAVDAFKRKYSKIILEAIDWSMEPDQRLRPQSCDELLEMLKKIPEEIEPQSFINKLSLNNISNVLPWKKSR